MQRLDVGGGVDDGARTVFSELVEIVRALVHEESRTRTEGLPLAVQFLLAQIRAEPGCRATDVAGTFGVHRSTISRQLRSCQRRGWVTTRENGGGMGTPLELTDLGRAVLSETEQAKADEVRARLRDWSEEDVVTLGRLLARFNAPDVEGAPDASARPRTDEGEGHHG